MANLIASGTAAATSLEFTLLDGQTAQIALFTPGAELDLPRAIKATIQYKNSAGTFQNFPDNTVTGESPVKILAGPGAFQVVKQASAAAFGVDKS